MAPCPAVGHKMLKIIVLIGILFRLFVTNELKTHPMCDTNNPFNIFFINCLIRCITKDFP